ncbi:MAG: DUF790 family protein [Chloroflexi bacterium]|nr:DUF790 family protein [Chloroflexota bacterium]
MAFSLKDVRYTIRRVGDGDPRLYPRLLRDRAVLPQIDIAIQYFETLLGSERRELDPEALVHFFGDYKLARCIVASLATTYCYRPLAVEQVVTRLAERRLRRAGLLTPKMLRLRLWDELNGQAHGFMDAEARTNVLIPLEASLGLRLGEYERLLALDAPEHAILSRRGEPPTPSDVLAAYNHGVLAALLTQAERIDLTLGRATGFLDAIRELAVACGVDIDLTSGTGDARLGVRGRQDALGSWTRHGRKVVRFLVLLLERVRPFVERGEAHVLPRGRPARLLLTDEVLDALIGGLAPAAGWGALDGWDETTLAGLLLSARRPVGWTVRRQPEARTWAAGTLVPDLLLQPTSRESVAVDATGALVCFVRSPAHGTRLAALAPTARGGEPLLFVGAEEALGALQSASAWTVRIERPALAPLCEALAERVLQTAEATPARRPRPSRRIA